MGGNTEYIDFELGDFPLQSGRTLKNARLAYKTYGTLNAAGDNCIVFPTYYTGTHESNARLIGTGRVLDPARYFIVVPNLPKVTIYDNVMAQHRLVTEHLGVTSIKLVTGWSMGAVQSFQWAALFPELVERLLPFCGAARCSPHNFVFLEGVKAALCADAAFQGGRYTSLPETGLRAFGRVYCGWAYSQAFFRDGLYRNLGCDSVEEFLVAWEEEHLAWDANDLLAKLWTWQHADLSANARFQGDHAAALGAIRAKTIIMPGDRDLYFPVEDSLMEADLIPGAELRPFRSDYGHCAGAPGRFPAETAFLEQALRELLAR